MEARRMVADDNTPVQSVVRAADVLLSLLGGPLSLASIADVTGLRKPTVHRLLATLSLSQLVIQNPATREYLLGPTCLGIADAVRRGLGGMDVIAGKHMQSLVDATQETVALYALVGTQRLCLASIPSPQPIRYTSEVGATKPLYSGSMGKILLAFTDESRRRELLDQMHLVPITAETITDRAVLDKQLAEARSQGYLVTRAEQTDEVASISAPVLSENGQVLAALSVLGPSVRMPDTVMARLRPMVIAAANEISRELGYVPGHSAAASSAV
jgi:IclR family acetate operon transcriptional repressor